MSYPQSNLAGPHTPPALKRAGDELDKEYHKVTGTTLTDEMHPLSDKEVIPRAPTVAQPTPATAPIPAPPEPKKSADAQSGLKTTVASDILVPFLTTKVVYQNRRSNSSYLPTSRMLMYIIHQANLALMDNRNFKQNTPAYHPYVLRLYFGILFWIQALRACDDARSSSMEQSQFLSTFLTHFRPESLPIIGPLIPLFKTICTSFPEIPTYGRVFPFVPTEPGPATRDGFIANAWSSFAYPNIPGIFALLENLNAQINAAANPIYPKKGKHLPVADNAFANAFVFGHHAYPAAGARTDLENWSFVTPGLEYPCEADSKLHENFAERYADFNFPLTAAGDILTEIAEYMSMGQRLDWFANVIEIAAQAAKYFEGSGTLADCSPSGFVSNQIRVAHGPANPVPAVPIRFFDPLSLFNFKYKLHTSARAAPPLAEALAGFAQTNAAWPPNHPYLAPVGSPVTKAGQFWDIAPTESSPYDTSAYLALPGLIRNMMKLKVD